MRLDDDELLIQTEAVALELMRQRIELHANGFFEINYRTFMQVIVMVDCRMATFLLKILKPIVCSYVAQPRRFSFFSFNSYPN